MPTPTSCDRVRRAHLPVCQSISSCSKGSTNASRRPAHLAQTNLQVSLVEKSESPCVGERFYKVSLIFACSNRFNENPFDPGNCHSFNDHPIIWPPRTFAESHGTIPAPANLRDGELMPPLHKVANAVDGKC